MDASELHPQLLARWQGAEDLINAVEGSLQYGLCRKILENLENKKVSVADASIQITEAIKQIHRNTH